MGSTITEERSKLDELITKVGDKDSGLIEKIDKLREEVDSFTDSDIINPNTFFSPELNPLG